MTTYSYAELERLWIDAGGPASEAPIAAAIAEAESGGNSDAHNPSGASGLWQILGNPFPGNPFDPATNAKMAVAKWKNAPNGGHNFTPWVTFTNGAFRGFLSGKTTPAAKGSVAGSPSAQTTAAVTGGAADCLVPNPLTVAVGPFSLGAGPSCLFTNSNARAFIGAGLLLAGGAVGLAGLGVLMAAAGMRAAQPLGKAAEGVGGALLLVPGAEGAGAAIGTAGRTARNPAREGRRRQAARGREERQRKRALGEPRENRDMETRGGTVRQSAAQRSAQRSRERRRVTGSGGAASREETGF